MYFLVLSQSGNFIVLRNCIACLLTLVVAHRSQHTSELGLISKLRLMMNLPADSRASLQVRRLRTRGLRSE